MPRAPVPPTRRAVLRAASLVPLASLGGCVVAPYGPYHRPSSQQAGSRLIKGWCQGQAGPETGIEQAFAGLRFAARTEHRRFNGPPALMLSAVLTVPPGRSLQWLGAPALRAEGRDMAWPLTVSARRGIAVAPGQWVDEAALRPGRAAADPAEPFGVVNLQAVPVAMGATRIVVEGLALERDGGRFVLPSTAMERPGGRSPVQTYQSAEERALDRARAEACRRDTPRRACDNILAVPDNSQSGQGGGWRWRGRWYASRRDNGQSQVAGEMKLVPLQGGRWRLSDEAFRLRDADGGAVEPLRVLRASVAYEDRLAPGAVLGAAGVDTRIHLQAELPEDAPTFELRLPALRVDGAPVEPLPIRFERRTFDGGVEPFNC